MTGPVHPHPVPAWLRRIVRVATAGLVVIAATAACSQGNGGTTDRAARQSSVTLPAAQGGAPSGPSSAPPAAAPGLEQGFAVNPVAAPTAARRGQMVTVAFQTRPGTACQLVFTDRREAPPAPLPPAVADGSGRVAWSWQVASDLAPGPAIARVACSGGATGEMQMTVT